VKPILVRDLLLERWPSMDRYADALATRMPEAEVAPGWRMHGPRYFTRYWRYPRGMRGVRGDLVHVLDHSYAHCLRSFPGMPTVVTVHDLHPLRVLAEGRRDLRGRVRDALLRRVLNWAERGDRVIVSTQFTAREVERFLHVQAGRIRVIPYGVDAHFFARPDERRVAMRRQGWTVSLTREGVPSHVILHVGSCAPRKNVETAITALGLLRAKGVDAVLIQVGGVFEAAHHAAIHAAGVADHVLQEPSVSEAGLVEAYYAADALVLPSRFEGFGLPAVEAMAAGLPVVTSGAGGLREAVGDAGVVTGTVDAPPLADALAELLPDAARRERLAERSRARAALMTWEQVVERTRAVYRELVNG